MEEHSVTFSSMGAEARLECWQVAIHSMQYPNHGPCVPLRTMSDRYHKFLRFQIFAIDSRMLAGVF